MRESNERIINIGKFNSLGMKVILEFIYTGIIFEESLNRDNIVEAFYAADFFQIPDLQDAIINHVKNILDRNPHDNYSPELLSKIIDEDLSNGEDMLLNLLIGAVCLINLTTIEFGRLSIGALRLLLSRTHQNQNTIMTKEYEVFRYSAILSAIEVSDEAAEYIKERLPTLENINESFKNDEYEIFAPKQEIARTLENLTGYIDFALIRGHELAEIIEPLNIVDQELFFKAYRKKIKLKSADSNGVRGIPPVRINFAEYDYAWDESTCGDDILIEDEGKIAKINDDANHNQLQCVRTAMELNIETTFEWDIIIERSCTFVWIGVCAKQGLDFDKFAGEQETAWVLGSSGTLNHSGIMIQNYCPPFGDNSKITVHVNMCKGNRNCAFTVDGTRYRVVTEWNDLPEYLYPVASFCEPARLRLKPYTLIQ
ncbi:20159_t:CDS:1 [Funneliformis geosporum]|nr:20159_t:CDS:1 [Funneliformis geosporum]